MKPKEEERLKKDLNKVADKIFDQVAEACSVTADTIGCENCPFRGITAKDDCLMGVLINRINRFA
jgi:hypothetical protein|nr:MAG TPA_asm: hypothetical protein [Caudoviricetes sp.]